MEAPSGALTDTFGMSTFEPFVVADADDGAAGAPFELPRRAPGGTYAF